MSKLYINWTLQVWGGSWLLRTQYKFSHRNVINGGKITRPSHKRLPDP